MFAAAAGSKRPKLRDAMFRQNRKAAYKRLARSGERSFTIDSKLATLPPPSIPVSDPDTQTTAPELAPTKLQNLNMSIATPTADDVEDLLLACRYGDLEDVQQFVDKFGPEPLSDARDERGNTVLHMAAGNGHTGMSPSCVAARPPRQKSSRNKAFPRNARVSVAPRLSSAVVSTERRKINSAALGGVECPSACCASTRQVSPWSGCRPH